MLNPHKPKVVKGESVLIDDRFSAIHFNSNMFDRLVGPVLMLDDFYMMKPTFPPHPHAGISAVTYVLPESKGSHISYDSMGQVIPINPGDLHWLCAGNGVVHTESPDKHKVHGLQLFINLPVDRKRIEPFSLHLKEKCIPAIYDRNVITKIVVGDYKNISSPLKPPVNMMLLDFSAEAKAVVEVPISFGWGGLIYVLSGSVSIKTNQGVYEINEGNALGFESDGSKVGIVAISNARWVVVFGEALHEPYVFGGPIIMESDEANLERFSAYSRGEFGVLTNYS